MGTIIKKLSNRSYLIKSGSGRVYTRNRTHIRPNKGCVTGYESDSGDDCVWEPNYSDVNENERVHNDITNDNFNGEIVVQDPNFSNQGHEHDTHDSLRVRDRRPPSWMHEYYT